MFFAPLCLVHALSLLVPDCLTAGEEQIIQDYYILGLQKMSSETLKLPLSVEATALAYFKRFYLNNSVMDYNPKDIMFTVHYPPTPHPKITNPRTHSEC